jgi:nanoRNase/pAp phosphatase (c-di-AMP/oligoRNAs hydrolase)
LAKLSEEAGLVAMAAIAYVEPSLGDSGVLKVSIRSIGDVDTSAISKHFGGGGHANASSFTIGKQTFDSWIRK